MSLLQLLSVSHSFKETTDRPGYRLGNRRVTPRLESTRNPALRDPARTGRTDAESQTSLFSELIAAPKRTVARGTFSRPAVVPVTPVIAPSVPAQAPKAPVVKAEPKLEAAPKIAERPEAKPEAREYSTKPHTAPSLPLRREQRSWKARLQEWISFGMGRKQPVTPFQAELALESVKVVRNDLKETDLVFSEPKPATVSAEASETPASESEKRKAARWMRLTTRVFGRTKNEFTPEMASREPTQGTLIPKA
jgi:hypothetical protein